MNKFLIIPLMTAVGLLHGDAFDCDCVDKTRSESTYVLENLAENLNDDGNAKTMTNSRGDVVWYASHESASAGKILYWSKEYDLETFDISNFLALHGLKPQVIDGAKWYDAILQYFDDSGDVFLLIQDMDGKHQIGVFNRKYGFKLLKIPEIECVYNKIQVSLETIAIVGRDSSSKHRVVVLKRPKSFWNDSEIPSDDTPVHEQVVSTTPWDKLPMGAKGARLYAIEKLVKTSCKSARKDRQVIDQIIEAEAVHLLDVLKADAKRAEALIEQAVADGKVNADAEKDYQAALKAMEALKQYLNKLKIKSNIFSLDLPSDNWDPSS